MGFEQGGTFIVPHLLWHGASVFPVSSEGPPHLVASYDTRGDVEDLFLPGSSRVPYQSAFTTHKGMWRTYSNPDPHGERVTCHPPTVKLQSMEGMKFSIVKHIVYLIERDHMILNLYTLYFIEVLKIQKNVPSIYCWNHQNRKLLSLLIYCTPSSILEISVDVFMFYWMTF